MKKFTQITFWFLLSLFCSVLGPNSSALGMDYGNMSSGTDNESYLTMSVSVVIDHKDYSLTNYTVDESTGVVIYSITDPIYWNQNVVFTINCYRTTEDGLSTKNIDYISTLVNTPAYEVVSEHKSDTELSQSIRIQEAAGEDSYYARFDCTYDKNNIDIFVSKQINFTTAKPELSLNVTADKEEIYPNEETTVTVTFSGNAVNTEECEGGSGSDLGDCLTHYVNFYNPDGGNSTALEVTHQSTSHGLYVISEDGSPSLSVPFLYVAKYTIKGQELSEEGKNQHVLMFMHDGLYSLRGSDSVTIKVVEKPYCGDGEVDTNDGEQCDDGDTESGDGCSSTCQLESCGNNVVDANEVCDDGNLIEGDGCSSWCTDETCTPENLYNYTSLDFDGDGTTNDSDNCPCTSNQGQEDADFDAVGDLCDVCPSLSNPADLDLNGNGISNNLDGDARQTVISCEVKNECGTTDTDGDGMFDLCDNCVDVANEDQLNADADAFGDVCDNCSVITNDDQADADGDSIGDVCEVQESIVSLFTYGTYGGACGCNINAVPTTNGVWLMAFLISLIGGLRLFKR